MLSRTQRSAIFTSYNRTRAAGDVERGRLNRALGLAQSGEERPYETTLESCTCPDWQYRISKTGGRCKHQLALELAGVIAEAQAAEAAAEPVAEVEAPAPAEELKPKPNINWLR